MTSEDAQSGAFEQTMALSPGGKVEVRQGRGRLSVAGWDRPEVRLLAYGTDVSRVLHIHSRGDYCSIVVRESRGLFGGLLSPSVELELQVPTTAILALGLGATDLTLKGVLGAARIDTGSGNVCCSEVGSVDVDCGSGNVEVRGAAGQVRVDSGSGNITLAGIRGDVRIDGSSGNLNLEQVQGSLEADTGSGNIVVRSLAGESLKLDTGSGDIQAGEVRVRTISLDTGSGNIGLGLGAVEPRGSYSVETGSGDVELRLPADAQVAVRIEAQRRRIENALPLTNVVVDDDELRGMMGDGSASLRVESHGRVRLSTYSPEPPAVPAPAAPAGLAAVPAAASQDPSVAPDLAEEYRRVLKMVEEGKLKPEEADEILRALEEGTEEEQA